VTKIKLTALLAVLGACLALSACGADDESEPIPAESAEVLLRQLDSIQARIEEGSVGACEDVLGSPTDPNVEPVEQAIADLPSDVSQDVRTGLEDGFNQLFELVDERCAELREEADAGQETDTQTEPPPPAPETDTDTETETVPETVPETDTETVPETVPPETDTGEQPVPPAEDSPDEGAGGAQGDGGAGGVIAPSEAEQG
jgi:septal ring-binding cell division protein DamX